MEATARRVFELAMHLMDEGDPSTGETDFSDTLTYKNRTPAILSVLQAECYPYSDSWRRDAPGKRPVCPAVESLDTVLALDATICAGILPYGLAAHLLLDENPDMASYFQQRYEELLKNAGRGLPAELEEIDRSYGDTELGEFSMW